MTAGYFDDTMVNRQRLLWAVATRRQLERWEPFVADAVRRGMRHGQLPGADIWLAATEHHFALVAARNLLRALDLQPASGVSIAPVIRDELIEGRDLHEHWPENLPIFNVTPRQAQPQYRSGKRFAARNPGRGPYWWLGWNMKEGALLLPNVAASAVHELLDAVEAEVLGTNEIFKEFVPPRAPGCTRTGSGGRSRSTHRAGRRVERPGAATRPGPVENLRRLKLRR